MSNARDIADAGHQLAAWVNFNGTITGTTVGSEDHFTTANNGIRAAYNVDYIIDRGTANYEVHFENELPDDKYLIVCSGTKAEGNGPYVTVPNTYSDTEYAPSSQGFRLGALVPGVSWAKDQKYVYCAVFR